MLNQIKVLLSDTQLRQQIKAAKNLAEAIALLKIASAEQGYQFYSNSLPQVLQSQSQPTELSETELLSIAGGFINAKKRSDVL